MLWIRSNQTAMFNGSVRAKFIACCTIFYNSITACLVPCCWYKWLGNYSKIVYTLHSRLKESLFYISIFFCISTFYNKCDLEFVWKLIYFLQINLNYFYHKCRLWNYINLFFLKQLLNIEIRVHCSTSLQRLALI